MKHDIAMKWVAALRSGNYTQTKGVLKDDTGYCCLGVLCAIQGREFHYSPEPLITHPDVVDPRYYVDDVESLARTNIGRNWSTLPTDLVRELEMHSPSGEFTPDGALDEEGYTKNYDLAELNDAGKTFDEIADLIEKHWEII